MHALRPSARMMSTRPLIGITTGSFASEDASPAGLTGWVARDRYSLAVAQAGGVPVLLPLLPDVRDLDAMVGHLHGVLIPGGADVDPCHYRAARHARSEVADTVRDTVELHLARRCYELEVPLLGVCRGAQVINIAMGGTLVQDIESELPNAMSHCNVPSATVPWDYLAHEVDVTPGSRLHRMLGVQRFGVNSIHHQAVAEVAPKLHASAVAPDGVVEAIESRDLPFFHGIQWHPEAMAGTCALARLVFAAFVGAARLYSADRGPGPGYELFAPTG
jgi:putative glutamine amidotransferase